jgi:triosephosphate isomerase
MTRVPLVAANWKLHLDPSQSSATAREICLRLQNRGDTEVVIFPTALSIPATLEALQNTGITVGIQDVHDAATGAFTGANSAVLARAAGCGWALIGHSERRHGFGETDEAVGRKVKMCLASGLLPMICVGETLTQRDAGQVHTVVSHQLASAFGTLRPDEVATTTLAYEPVWAIGTGRTATPEQAQEAHASIRSYLSEHYPAYVAEQVRILYGGSVKANNAAALMACKDVDGALVGGASLEPDSFAAIVSATRP